MNLKCISLAAVVVLAGSAVVAATDWPGMGGPSGNHSAVDPDLPADWTGVTGRAAWRFPLTGATMTKAPGQVAIVAGRVYFVDRNSDNTQAILRVLDLDDGREAWSFAWPIAGEPAAGEERPFGAPAVSRDYVFLSGPEDSTLRAVDLKTHAQVWTVNVPQMDLWSSGCASPEVVDDAVVLIARTVERDTRDVLLAFDQTPGARRWTCAMPKRGGFRTRIQNAPQVVTLYGARQIVVHHQSGVAGVSLEGNCCGTGTAIGKAP